jgi:hypothetical protein
VNGTAAFSPCSGKPIATANVVVFGEKIVFVTKATYVDGAVASAELWTTYAGKYSHRTAKYAPDGLPQEF